MQFLELPQFRYLLLLDLFELHFLLLLVVCVSRPFQALDCGLAHEVVVGVEVEEGDLESGAHDEAVAQEVGLVDPEGGHCDSVGFAQEVKVRH